jgi:hypothetical protein
MKVYAMAPPMRMWSAVLGSRLVIAGSLSETLAPPRMTTKGASGLASVSERYLISFSTRKPTSAGLALEARGTATMHASVRWQVPKASLT